MKIYAPLSVIATRNVYSPTSTSPLVMHVLDLRNLGTVRRYTIIHRSWTNYQHTIGSLCYGLRGGPKNHLRPLLTTRSLVIFIWQRMLFLSRHSQWIGLNQIARSFLVELHLAPTFSFDVIPTKILPWACLGFLSKENLIIISTMMSLSIFVSQRWGLQFLSGRVITYYLIHWFRIVFHLAASTRMRSCVCRCTWRQLLSVWMIIRCHLPHYKID